MRVFFSTIFALALLGAYTLTAEAGRIAYFVDPPSLVFVIGGTFLFMLFCYRVSELWKWLLAGLGIKRLVLAEEFRIARRMCVAAAIATLTFGFLGVMVNAMIMLQNLSNPYAIGPSIAIALTSSLYSIFFAGIVITAMWAQITRAEM